MLGISCPIEDLNINLVIFQFKNHFYIIIIQRHRDGATKLNLGGLRVEFTDIGPTTVGQRARIFLIRPSRLAKKVSPELKINRIL